jgi:DNA-directed RNA polymerase specialized sigma24 family protein
MKNQTENSANQLYADSKPISLAMLAELHKDSIYDSIYKRVQNKYLADEIFRDVFMILINNMLAGRKTDSDNFLAWAIQIANQLCEDQCL